jgi:CBS domain-containing protein
MDHHAEAGVAAALRSITVDSFLRARREKSANVPAGVVVIETTCSVGEALERLAASHITSAPLVTPASGATDSGYRVLAFMSVRDILRHFTMRARDTVPPSPHLLQRMAALAALGHSLAGEQALSLHVQDDGDMLYASAAPTTTMLDVVRGSLLRGPVQRPALPARHRVGVFDSHGHVTDIISQSDVVAWLRSLGPVALGPIAGQSLHALGLACGRTVITVPATLPTDQALAVLVGHQSSVGVVDAGSGALVGTLSDSDFRGCLPWDLGSLALPVAQWLVHAKGVSVIHDGKSSTIRDPWAHALFIARIVISLPPTATLLEVMDTLVTRRIHRVFIVSTAGAPLAVVSHTDVLNALLHRALP